MSSEKNKWEDSDEKVIGLCNRSKRRVCAKKREGISVIKERKRRSVQVHWRIFEKEIYQTLKIASNSTSVFYKEEI